MNLRYQKLVDKAGQVVFDELGPPTNIQIHVDANDDPTNHISTVVHELLHVILFTMFIGFVDDTIEEIMIVALEAELYKYIKRSKSRLTLWNDLISRKLVEAPDGTAQ